ncbi:hypothetical protein CC78DRAFT_532578 [Lojkania enalia]|uniref:Mis12 domain-containing protein n=1 Tax=Lojkania enalia TaxID=147567 RepID=A0A9P4KAN2_9PLEO|nr:hypothetical protein CC78DRAFT_532578 [Didymosphaeria enalia]
MATQKQQENLLLTEHLTFPPISLLDEIINSINLVLYDLVDKLETGLSSTDPSNLGYADQYAAERRAPERDEEGNEVYPEARLEIEEGVQKFETLMMGALDKNFDRLEIWTLRNVLCLPEDVGEWVRLGHYENLTIPQKDPKITPETLHALHRKLLETQKLHAALIAEKTRNDAQIRKLRSLLQPPGPKPGPRSSTSPTKAKDMGMSGEAPFAFLSHTPAAQDLGVQSLPQNGTSASTESRTPLTTHTTFTASQLPYLRELLATLKPHLSSTALPLRSEGGKEDLANERRVYIESQSKRILERRGVDTVDGVEGVIEGPRVRTEEVRGLEDLVQGLGRGREVDEMDVS